eukprot:4130619-Amphidinium_carterae.1
MLMGMNTAAVHTKQSMQEHRKVCKSTHCSVGKRDKKCTRSRMGPLDCSIGLSRNKLCLLLQTAAESIAGN